MDISRSRGFLIGSVILLIFVIIYYQSMTKCPDKPKGCGCGCESKAAFVPAPNVKSYDLGNGIVIDPTGTFNSADQYAVRFSP